VLAGLEVVRWRSTTAPHRTRRPLVVAVFTNEEGARFQPDMLGSLVYAGGLPWPRRWPVGIDGRAGRRAAAHRLRRRHAPLPLHRPHAFVELHIEQGPVLEAEGVH
jgi:N-carbamoyl-L-amino-acid hydrolase